MASVERISIILWTRRSATRPHSGEAKAATNGVSPLRMPDHKSIARAVLTPSTGKNSGMIGVSTEKAIVLTNWMPTIAHKVRCHAVTAPRSRFSITPLRSFASECRSV